MEIYLIDKQLNKVKREYSNVIDWSQDYVEFINDGFRSKIYCDAETEYFSDTLDVLNEQLAKEREVKDGLSD